MPVDEDQQACSECEQEGDVRDEGRCALQRQRQQCAQRRYAAHQRYVEQQRCRRLGCAHTLSLKIILLRSAHWLSKTGRAHTDHHGRDLRATVMERASAEGHTRAHVHPRCERADKYILQPHPQCMGGASPRSGTGRSTSAQWREQAGVSGGGCGGDTGEPGGLTSTQADRTQWTTSRMTLPQKSRKRTMDTERPSAVSAASASAALPRCRECGGAGSSKYCTSGPRPDTSAWLSRRRRAPIQNSSRLYRSLLSFALKRFSVVAHRPGHRQHFV